MFNSATFLAFEIISYLYKNITALSHLALSLFLFIFFQEGSIIRNLKYSLTHFGIHIFHGNVVLSDCIPWTATSCHKNKKIIIISLFLRSYVCIGRTSCCVHDLISIPLHKKFDPYTPFNNWEIINLVTSRISKVKIITY